MTKNLDNASAQLISLVERIERLSEEIEGLGDDRKEVYAEAKSAGFDTKTLRRAIALRKIPKTEREEAAAVLETYMEALEKQERQALLDSVEAGA